MRLRSASVLLLCLSCLCSVAQQTRSLVPDINTVRLLLNGEAGRLPVLRLGSKDVLELSFDNLTHEYERFEYRLVHCDRDWQPSEGILLSDAVDYIQESTPIEEYDYSMNTLQLYTHYRFEVPSDDARPRISGNYRIEVARDGDYEDGLVAVACFMVTEDCVNISLSTTDDTEVDWRVAHQQVLLTLDYGRMSPLPSNPREELTTVVLQNQRWDNARRNVAPDYLIGNTMKWEHARGLVFPAGNEYRRFENTTSRHAAMGMESLRYYEPYYHATLRLAEPRRNYIYEQDKNGLRVIRTIDSPDIDTQAEYMYVHFELAMNQLPEGQHVYVQSQWSGDWLSPDNELYYNAERGIYERALYLKQGYYNFQYLVSNSPTQPGRTAPIEGDYFQTENEYNVLVYYRNPFDRYDRLVGYR